MPAIVRPVTAPCPGSSTAGCVVHISSTVAPAYKTRWLPLLGRGVVMGLHTTYVGHVVIDPPLSPDEVDFVRRFGHTRHYDAGESRVRLALHPSDDDASAASEVSSYNRPAPGMPGLWCPWTVCKDGCCLHW